jgi:hypothetical protein
MAWVQYAISGMETKVDAWFLAEFLAWFLAGFVSG